MGISMTKKTELLIIIWALLAFLSCSSGQVVIVKKSSHPVRAKNYGQKVASRNHVENGKKFFHKGKFPKALQEFNKAVDKDPNNYEAFYYLGLTQQKMGNFKRSVASFEMAIELNKGDKLWVSEIRVSLGQSYESLGNFDKAKAEYQFALSIDPSNKEASEGYGRVKRRNKK
jgi:Tfp pilus assembly protein PilF